MPEFTVGLDWGAHDHSVCVVDDSGSIRARWRVPHDREGLARLLRDLRRLTNLSELPIAIERPSGLLVDTLMDAGHPVNAIHPNVVMASRTRYRASHSKSGDGDAYLLADLLRTDHHRFAPARPRSDEIRAVRAPTRTRNDQLQQQIMRTNRPRAHLDGCHSGGARIFANLNSPIALAFLQRHRTLNSTLGPGEKRLKNAIITWANNSRHADPWAKALCARARARGHRHHHAAPTG